MGPERYEIPGILQIDGVRLTVSASTTIEETAVRVVSPATGQPLLVLRPGHRLAGRATGIKDGIVEFLPDGQPDTLSIPLDSIGKLEVSELRMRPRVLRGILVGVATFYGLAFLFMEQCGLECDSGVGIVAIGGGLAAGGIAGRGGERWKAVPADWLLSQFGPPPALAPRPAEEQDVSVAVAPPPRSRPDPSSVRHYHAGQCPSTSGRCPAVPPMI